MAQTLAEIREALKVANRAEYEALARALVADERKGVKAALKSAARRLAAEDAEAARLNGMYSFQAKLAGGGIAVGLDEVGRGPVAGPLAIGAVVLPDDPRVEGVNDSKQLSAERREEIAAVVREVAIAWDIEYIQPQEIDERGPCARRTCVPSRPSRSSFLRKALRSMRYCSMATRSTSTHVRSTL